MNSDATIHNFTIFDVNPHYFHQAEKVSQYSNNNGNTLSQRR